MSGTEELNSARPYGQKFVIENPEPVDSGTGASFFPRHHPPNLIRREILPKVAADGIQGGASLIAFVCAPEPGPEFEGTLDYHIDRKLLIYDVQPIKK
jgi:hypothetical protein